MRFFRKVVRRIATLRNLAAATAVWVALAPAGALADNAAIAVNTKNGSDLIKIAFKVERFMQDTVAPTNAAIAISSCSSCQTVAIAVDVVFVMSDPNVYAPTNLAIAMNIGCSNCNTLADAYQFAMTTGGPVHLTPEGEQEVARIRQQLEQLRHSDGTIFEIQQQVSLLMLQLQQVLSTQVVPVPPDQGQPAGEQPAPAASPAPTASPSPSAAPSASPPASSPSPSPS
ncbi:MAG TPA: hypothetical protein VF160_01425 [Candidatus Dormibacteraeota bacterium]